ncbi:MAG TPA: hypothetical protein VNT75_29495 [Symbiobacteriaceae bacterium]|nr:hypothetical protein [Symbiobacteriaceae bacterium]
MVEKVTTRARTALAEWLTQAAADLPGKGAGLHYLNGPPAGLGELPAISITFPASRVRPTGLGGVVGLETPARGNPYSLLGARLEGTARFDLWVGAAAGTPPPLQELMALTGWLGRVLAEPSPALRKAGVLRLRLVGTGEVQQAQALPVWQIAGAGLTCSVTCELVYEATFAPDEVEGVIKSVQVAVGDQPGDKFKVR